MEKNWEDVQVPIEIYNGIVKKLEGLKDFNAVVSQIKSDIPGFSQGEIERACELGCSVQEYRDLARDEMAFQMLHRDDLQPTDQLSPIQKRMEQWHREVDVRLAKGETRDQIDLANAKDCLRSTEMRQYQEEHARPMQAQSSPEIAKNTTPTAFSPI